MLNVSIWMLVLLTWVVAVFHSAVLVPQTPSSSMIPEGNQWIPRTDASLNHLVLKGNDYQRGLYAGQATKKLLDEEEDLMVTEFEKFFPNPVIRWGLSIFAMRWFSGIEHYFYPWALQEMQGVAQASSDRFDYLIDPYTRQLVYHGVHEVGQMFVDFEKSDFGCTAVGAPTKNGWIIGRNFDFEAIRLFDLEKIVKWVFPQEGAAFVSITWAGMVGVVTGVNEHGVYVSINSAGSRDFSRYGTPTTLVVLKALQEARNASEARQIIEDAQVFITDIFIVADHNSAFQIEKSPERSRYIKHLSPFAATNHLVHPEFQEDGINLFRKNELTSSARLERAGQLILRHGPRFPKVEPTTAATLMASILRDKQDVDDHPLVLGNRRSLDALIATHSVVYHSESNQLFVSQGPALTGPYFGYDLQLSFATGSPVRTGRIEPDRNVSPEKFTTVRRSFKQLSQIRQKLSDSKNQEGCRGLHASILALDPAISGHPDYLTALGDSLNCMGETESAQQAWSHALEARPAYSRKVTALKERLNL